MNIIGIFLLVVTLLFLPLSTQALICYKCTYLEGSNNPNHSKDCENNPPASSHLNYCDPMRSTNISVSATEHSRRTLPSSNADKMPICFKARSIRDGKKFIERDCYAVEKEHVGKCLKMGFRESGGTTYKDLEHCYCEHDACNMAVSLAAKITAVIVTTISLGASKHVMGI